MRPYFTEQNSLWDIHRALTEATTQNPVTVFVDMDGVLADFQVKFLQHFKGQSPIDIDRTIAKLGWAGIGEAYPELFAELPRMPDAQVLMSGLLKLQNEKRISIHILTALPNELIRTRSYRDKLQWMSRYFPNIRQQDIHIVTRSQKQNFATASELQGVAPVLIDDFKKNINEWQAAGGFGIVHTSATTSLNHLLAYLRRTGVR